MSRPTSLRPNLLTYTPHLAMPTLALTVRLPDRYHEFLIAELSDLDFVSFEERDAAVIAYAPAERWSDASREEVERWLTRHRLPVAMEERVEPDENWNAKWEATIEPQAVGAFLLRPPWHDAPPEHADKLELVLEPKMAFGTGYHPTTRLVLRFLPGLVGEGAKVLDAGCGTGVLAFGALRLGAASALGFDIDPWSRVNAEENAERNGLDDRFEVREGSLEVIPESGFDLVLANINRRALLDMLPGLADRLTAEGAIVLAGLLDADRFDTIAAADRVGLRLYDEASEAGWWSGAWKRT